MAKGASRVPTVYKADLLAELLALVRRVLGRPDFRLGRRGQLRNREIMALLEALQKLEGQRCRNDAS